MPILEVMQDYLYAQMDTLRREVIWNPFNLTTPCCFNDEEERSTSFACVKDGKMLACATLTPSEDKKTIRARLVAVYPEHQRKGLGQKLMQVCEKKAAEMGFDELGLFAHSGSHPFYVKLGYEEAGQWQILPNGFQIIFMKKKI